MAGENVLRHFLSAAQLSIALTALTASTVLQGRVGRGGLGEAAGVDGEEEGGHHLLLGAGRRDEAVAKTGAGPAWHGRLPCGTCLVRACWRQRHAAPASGCLLLQGSSAQLGMSCLDPMPLQKLCGGRAMQKTRCACCCTSCAC